MLSSAYAWDSARQRRRLIEQLVSGELTRRGRLLIHVLNLDRRGAS
jgi:hypothetical protein